MRFTKPKKALGLDIGTHSVKAAQMSRVRGRLRVEELGYALVDRDQVSVDPVAAHADAVREAVRGMQVSQSMVVGALPGQTAVIRYPRLPDMPYSQIAEAIETEAGQSIPYDLSEVYLDWFHLDTVDEGDERMLRILLVAAKHAVIESRTKIAEAADIEYGVLTVDSLALADAAETCDFLRVGESVALVDIGLTSSSIHFTKDGVSNFIRDVSWGAREFIQAVAKLRHCEYEEAERILQAYADEEGHELGLPALEEETQTGAGVEDVGELETPDLETYASPLDPLDEEFGGGGLGDDTASLGAAPPVVDTEDAGDVGEALSQSLSRLVSEIRRSFDYYEHQLYERPVDRLILCGGVAHLDLLRNNLVDELGVESVTVADPTSSAVVFEQGSATDLLSEHPAKYMVALGLAARGMADL